MKKRLIGFLFAVLCLLTPLSAQMVYEEEPKDFNPKMEVAVCFIRVDNQFLFLKRLPTKPQGNTWGIPGGKSDPGENAAQTVTREIREETGIDIPEESVRYFGEYYVRYPEMDYIFHMFEYQLAELPEVQISPLEHAGYRWVSFEEAMQMPLIPGEEECINLVYGNVTDSAIDNTG
jgi:mutator protein MutT